MKIFDAVEDFWGWLKYGSIALLLLGIITISFTIGAHLGRANSPDYDSKDAAYNFVLSNSRNHFDAAAKTTTVTLRAGPSIYKYRYPAETLVRLRPVDDLTDYRPPRRWRLLEKNRISELLGLSSLATGGLLGQLKNARAVPGPSLGDKIGGGMSKARLYALLVAGTVTGGIVGYWINYDDTMDYENEKFVEALKEKWIWRAVARPYHICKEMDFVERTDTNYPRVDRSIEEIHGKNQEHCNNLEKFIEEPID